MSDARLLRLKRWMVFVDGENFTLQAQKLLKGEGLTLLDGARFYNDVFIWNASSDPMNPELRLASDYFFDMSGPLVSSWRSYIERAKEK